MANPNAIFEYVKGYNCPHSAHNLTHPWIGTIPLGALVPVGVYEVLPGDIARVNSEVFCRLMPMIAPVLAEMDVYVHHFEIPYRLIWNKYEQFLFPQKNETAASIPINPYLNGGIIGDSFISDSFAKNTLADYLGVPPLPGSGTITDNTDRRISILPFLAYQLIYNEYFRSEDLDSEVDVDSFKDLSGAVYPTLSGNKIKDILTLRYRGWEKDYFTSCLPTAQLNSPARVNFSAAMNGTYNVTYNPDAEDGVKFVPLSDSHQDAYGAVTTDSDQTLNVDGYPARIDPNNNLRVVIQNAQNTGYIDVETIRAMIAKQQAAELYMRGGHRPSEIYQNVFNIRPDDLTIGRPRYLGGGKQNLVISEVLSHTENDEVNLGSMGGHGIAYGSNNAFYHQFKEFGFFMTILSIRPRSIYGQGLERFWTKFNRDEYANPLYAKLGEQPVKAGELFFSYTDGKNDDTFGYLPIYTDYRRKLGSIHGDMRDSLSFWHMARMFQNRPNLNSDFIHIDPSDFDRNFPVNADVSNVQCIAEVKNHVKMIRPIPADGTPKMII